MYKVVDGSGRIIIPKFMRDEAGINIGDIVKVSVDTDGNTVRVSSFDFIDLSEVSEKNIIHNIAAMENMSDEKKVQIATYLLGSIQKPSSGGGEK